MKTKEAQALAELIEKHQTEIATQIAKRIVKLNFPFRQKKFPRVIITIPPG